MAGVPWTLRILPDTVTTITAIKLNGNPITPKTYTATDSPSSGGSGLIKSSSYAYFAIDDFVETNTVEFTSEGYQNFTATVGDSTVYELVEVLPTIAFYKHAGVTYEIEDEKARNDIATKQDALATQTAYTSKGSATKVPQITTNSFGQVTGITEVTITHPTEIPSQSGNSGKFLTTNGSAVSWATVDALPSQSGQSSKFLTTDGSSASWSESTTWTYDSTNKILEIS